MRKIFLILLLAMPAITAFSQLNYTSKNNYTGTWENGASWTKAEAWMADPPPATTLGGGQITTIYGYITRNGDLTLTGNANIYIYDTLVVTGKLTVANNGITVQPGGLLIVLGDFESTTSGGAKITNNGDIVIGGEFTHWEGTITGGTDFYIYDDTPFIDAAGAPFPNNTENEQNLYNNDRPLYDFVAGLGICGGSNSITASQNLCGSGTPAALVGSTLTNVTYVWQSSTTSATAGFTTAAGTSNAKNYSPGALTQTTWYRRVANGISCTSTSNVVQIRIVTGTMWTGASSSVWSVAGNWCNGVPTSTTDAVIPSGLANYPTSGFGDVRNITIDAGASISINSTLNVYGNINNSGTFGFQSSTAGTVAFMGSSPQTVTSTSAIVYSNMTLNNNEVIFTSSATVNRTLTMTAGIINVGNNTLTLGTSATGATADAGTLTYTSGKIVTGASGLFTRYIRSGSQTLVRFPMGTAGDNRPFVFSTSSNISTGGAMSVNHTGSTAVTTGLNVVESPVANGPIVRRQNSSWTVTHSGMSGGTFTISAGGTGFGTVGSLDDLRLLRANAIIPGSTNFTATGTPSDFAVRRQGVTLANLVGGSFFVGSINNSQTPLPVELISFTGQNTEEGVLLKWSTSMEKNFDRFEIERSSDGLAFNYAGKVQGKGGIAVKTDYAFVDGMARNGKYYYRLRNVDLDETFEYSNVIVVLAYGDDAGITVYPNPVRDKKLSVVIPQHHENGRIVISDQLGTAVYQADLAPGEQDVQLADSLKQGFYIARIIVPGEAPKVIKLWIE